MLRIQVRVHATLPTPEILLHDRSFIFSCLLFTYLSQIIKTHPRSQDGSQQRQRVPTNYRTQHTYPPITYRGL